MTPPQSPRPEPLLRKPGTVTAAQTLMWIQFSLLVCCGTGGTFIALFWSGLLAEIGMTGDVTESAENLVTLAAVVVLGIVGTAILFGILAAKIGAGRRWAQVMTIAIMLATINFGFIAVYTGFQVEERAGKPVDTSDLVWALLSLAMPAITMICLFTGSANQWFRQGGRRPLQPHPAPAPY
ncbi:hypothetical protein GCM10027447_10920 [Glycomyces halotolerans]